MLIALLLLSSLTASAEPLQIFVSVAPQKLLLERVGGDQVVAHVMVTPGRSPATYEPQPRQVAALESADLYLAIGVPFEAAWLPRIRRAVPGLRIEDLRTGLALRPLDHGHGDDEQGGDGRDPHVWTDPRRCLQMAARIRDLLTGLRPGQGARFAANYETLAASLRELDAELQAQLLNLRSRVFLVFHPAWGYFAERYHLEQVAIEHEGKEPGARALATLIERARAGGVHLVFAQPQFNQRLAETVARAIDGRVIVADPLAEDCLASLRRIAAALAESGV